MPARWRHWIAEGAGEVFEEIALQGLGPQQPVPWIEAIHGYADGGSPGARVPVFPPRQRPGSPRHWRRSALRCFWRSSASLRRLESPSMATTSALWTRRSIRATTQAAFGKASPHSAKGRLVVTMVEFCCERLETMLNSRSAIDSADIT